MGNTYLSVGSSKMFYTERKVVSWTKTNDAIFRPMINIGSEIYKPLP